MNIVSGITAEQPDGTFRKLSISLNFSDLLSLVAEGRVPGHKIIDKDGSPLIVDDDQTPMPVHEMVRVLKTRADAYLLSQMAKEGLISSEEAARQIREL